MFYTTIAYLLTSQYAKAKLPLNIRQRKPILQHHLVYYFNSFKIITILSLLLVPLRLALRRTAISQLDSLSTILRARSSKSGEQPYRMTSLRDRKIVLTEDESNIFDIVMKSLEMKKRNTIPRVAGGWVRDKLLDFESDDIDIALDDQSGVEFANNVNDYLKVNGLERRSVAVIQANPDQSKHLETANISILKYQIDCVNLRAETYAENSRIPEIRIGTPYEDAMRRDFTINSLFYNLKTKEVEDFTGKGIEDIEQGVIRTPLPPMSTFTDDPLRVLRAVRFASRYNFQLADDVILTASNETIQAALTSKVSRERVLKELSGMMNSKGHPFVALNMLHRLNLLDCVLCANDFKDSLALSTEYFSSKIYTICHGTSITPLEMLSMWKEVSVGTSLWLSLILAIRNRKLWTITEPNAPLLPCTGDITIDRSELLDIRGGDENALLFYSAMSSGLSPFITLVKNKPFPFVTTILRESLKMDTDTMRNVQTILNVIPQLYQYSIEHLSVDPSAEIISLQREQAGVLIRQTKDLWHDALLIACAFEITALRLSNSTSTSKMEIDEVASDTDTIESIKAKLNIEDFIINPEEQNIMNRYKLLEYRWGHVFGLDRAYDLKPILDGIELTRALPGLKKGPMIGKIMDEQIRWQLRHPDGTLAELVPSLQLKLESKA